MLAGGVELLALASWMVLTACGSEPTPRAAGPETTGGWRKHPANPVLGGQLGTCFDVSVLRVNGKYRMWFSWRPRASVALAESTDGVSWSEPIVVLGPNPPTTWEDKINRPAVIRLADGYHLWYTGQSAGNSWIGYATSSDGRSFRRRSAQPVLAPQLPWEKVAVMCPDVRYDTGLGLFRMWYSAGEQYEPNAIGYATSRDGLRWTKHPGNPIFMPEVGSAWERDRVTACHVVPLQGWHLMFYIGFEDRNRAQIGVARSRDGVSGWQRHPANPIIRPGPDGWDKDAVYKPYAIFDGVRWLLWYNGRRDGIEQIGLATHEGEDLGF